MRSPVRGGLQPLITAADPGKRDGLEGRTAACAGAHEPLKCPPAGFPGQAEERTLGRTLHAGTEGSWVPSPPLHH